MSAPLPTASGAVRGEEMLGLAGRLFPIHRSLTGDGVRETLDIVSQWAPLEITEVPSGTPVYDWVVPPEWSVRAAWVAEAEGARIVDLSDSPLHVVGYSVPHRGRLRGGELRKHLYSLPLHPEWIPYRTAYYDRTWGFCLSDDTLARVRDDALYDVEIDSTLDERGSLTYGECVIPGRTDDELLVSTFVCHPALANDNVSGVVVAAALARVLADRPLSHTVRILFAPATLGALLWLQRREADGELDRFRGGLVIGCMGDSGPLSYKRSRRGNAAVDRAAELVLACHDGASVRDFVPWGTDERQFCSPGFDLPVGALSRTPNGMYAEYHSSADNLDLLRPESLESSLDALHEILLAVDANITRVRVEARGEPQLSRHSIRDRMSASLMAGNARSSEALFWVLNLADGEHDLLEIASRAGLELAEVIEAARLLVAADILSEAG